MQIIENRALLIRTRSPEKYAVIPDVRVLEEYEDGVSDILVRWRLDEVRLLRNLGVKKAPSPITGRYEWPGRYKPAQHQIETAAFLTLHRRAFCFNEPGTMKTISALWAADYLMRIGEVRRVLVLCPMSIMHSAWLGDISNSVIHRSAVVAHHSKASRRIELVQGDYEIVIANYEGLNLIAPEVKRDGRFDLVIVDEGNAYSNAQTDRWKALASILTPDMYLWMMTGTPAAQSPVHAYGLAKLVCPQNVPKFFTGWRDQVMLKISNFKWVAKPNARDMVFAALQPAIRFTKAECLDLPPVVTETREVEMTPQQKKYYDQLKAQMLITAAGETITAVNAGVAVSKLLQISCIAYNTPVLTNSGWVPIQQVRDEDLVWDGEEFVAHQGLLHQGHKKVTECFSVDMTFDHRVLTEGGWRTAWSCLYECGEGFDRASVRLPNGVAPTRYERWENEKGAVALPVRLRQPSCSRESVPAHTTPPGAAALRLPAWKQDARYVEHAALPHLDEHAQALPGPERQGLAQLRGARDHRVQGLGGVVRGVLGGRRADLLVLDDLGTEEQQRPLLEAQLQVGNLTGTGEQHAQDGVVENTEGANAPRASGPGLRAAFDDTERTLASRWMDAEEGLGNARKKDVFDIAHCGPRSRFVVLGKDGVPLIVHNCGAAYTDNKEVIEFDAGPRLKVLREVFDETDRKVIIFAMFRSSMDTIAQFLEKCGINAVQIHGDVSPGRRGQIIKDFQSTDNVRALVMQPQATAHGITLTAADTVVFFGPLMSVELYLQCIARADRKGQTSTSVRVIHIQGSPIEKKLFKAMGGKVSDHSLLVGLFDNEIKSK